MARINLSLIPQSDQGGPPRRGGDVSSLLARIWAQADDLIGKLENAPLAPRDQAAVLATLARIMPQLVAAEREAGKALAGRDLSTLTNAELATLIDRTRADRSR